jgi:hypothetical protein
MLAVYFAHNYPETTQVLALENPIGLEDYRSAIPPQPIETLVKTERCRKRHRASAPSCRPSSLAGRCKTRLSPARLSKVLGNLMLTELGQ